ncbi:MAG: type II toxin-antitoxin system RelE/ParE family toxin [Betaproteobacteria bacterium]|nr:MAG: type II toxin-antitoxin system RelE/ParE family toxin [Betaproteobacteria bacterium]
MAYEARQTRRFARQYKKLHDNVASDVDEAVVDIVKKPTLGERKKGDLSALRVHKFKSQGQLYLLGYTIDDSISLVYLEAIGSHENFYRDFKH